ncbi:MAG: exodeoxyribonuclease VII small subunit [Oscillospiraceae bacterium]|nr:exodeoxyribonuclease VII small subunit [Oscillospiraceae bacterium]
MKQATFEDKLKRLDDIVKRLEQGDAPLDDALKLFDEGAGLVTQCNAMLDGAEQKVRLILKGDGGDPQESLFDDK